MGGWMTGTSAMYEYAATAIEPSNSGESLAREEDRGRTVRSADDADRRGVGEREADLREPPEADRAEQRGEDPELRGRAEQRGARVGEQRPEVGERAHPMKMNSGKSPFAIPNP